MNTDLAIPESKETALNLPSDVLYQLERAGALATEILDERVATWAEDGWTQRQMAEEIGCSQQAIAKRLNRLGVRTTSNRGRPRNNNPVVIQRVEDEHVPDEDIEIIEDTSEEVKTHCSHCEIHCPSSRYRKGE